MTLDRWSDYSLAFQLTSINADLRRAKHQRELGRPDSATLQIESALSLIDLTLQTAQNTTRRREVGRLREVVADQLLTTRKYQVELTAICQLLDPYGLIVARERGVA